MASPSPWVYTTVEVVDPPESDEPSKWVFTTVTVGRPHRPIVVKTDDGLGFTRRLTKTSTGLR